MKKQLLAIFIGITAGFTAKAQMPYSLAVQNQAYQELTGTTSVNGTTIWDDDNYIIPLGFNFQFGGKTMTSLDLIGLSAMGTDTSGIMQMFSLIGTDLSDRGSLGSSSKSPVRYTVTGAAGSKIFKLELFNAGFSDEMYTYNTLDDSLNLQLWLYEATNAIEIHFGSSKISHMADYFFFGGPMIGYAKNMDIDQGDFDVMYALKGSPAAPTIDSVEKGSFNFPSLNAYPPSGTVYTFTPKPATAIKNIMTDKITVYPTQCTDAIYIENDNVPDTYYQLLSLTGNVVKNGKVDNGRNKIDISNLTAGMYIVRLDNITGYEVKKVIKL